MFYRFGLVWFSLVWFGFGFFVFACCCCCCYPFYIFGQLCADLAGESAEPLAKQNCLPVLRVT
jgi:hypothetical protein